MAGELVLVIDDSPTITKVVQLVLTKAGYQVATAVDGEAGLEAVRAQRPHMILLDFVMPRMNGYQFCRELVADVKLRDIPVVLMSAKGDQVGERFVKVMGIVDYITKPFSPEAITAVVQHTIGKYTAGREDEPSLVTGEDLSATDDADRTHARSGAMDKLRMQITDVVSGRIAALFALAHATREPDGAIATDATAVADAMRTALDDPSLLKMLTALDLGLFGENTPGLRGDLRVVPLAEVLQLLDVQEQSGVLTVERSGARVDIYFRRGRVDQATAEGVPDEFLLGRFVTDAELMNRADFDAFLDSRETASGTRLIGAQLVKLGYLAEADLKSCLTRQSSELIYEILRWRHGRFRFVAGLELPPSVIDAALGLDVEAVLMEGYRRVDEWHLIERAIDNFDVVFLRNEDSVAQMGRGRLTREELAVLEVVNGKNSVKDIIRKSRMGSFEVSKMLYRLLSIKLVRRRVLPVAV
ncbi:MAG: response regulator [Deltaproteobacteria bacterium]|nr:response regulator [Deltaproteobacteria bacterium]